MAFDPTNCTDETIDCNNNTLTTEQLLRYVFTVNEDGCLVLRTSGGGVGDASAANQLLGNASLEIILTRLNAILPSGTETPSASSVGVGVGSVTSGKISVTFTTSSDFTGTILGVTRNPSTTYRLAVVNPGKTLAAIAYNVTAGSMIIDETI